MRMMARKAVSFAPRKGAGLICWPVRSLVRRRKRVPSQRTFVNMGSKLVEVAREIAPKLAAVAPNRPRSPKAEVATKLTRN